MFSKKLITLLVLMIVMVGGTAMAGDDAGYKLYGKLHQSLNMMNDSDNSQLGLSSNTSRFGVKGYKELNENFKIIWQFESFINIAQGGGNLSTRNTFIGLKGNWGSFIGGIHDTPFKTIYRKTTFFYDTVGDGRSTLMGWDRRVNDMVMYSTPDLSGFKAALQYRMDQNAAGDDEAATGFSGAAWWANEAFLIAAAYENWTKGNYMDDFDMDPTTPDTYGEAASGFRATAKWSGEKLAISALYQSLSNNGGWDELKSSTFGGEAQFAWAEKWAAKALYFMADPNTDADDDDYSLMGIGIDHNFAKDVQFYIQYAAMMNGDASAVGVGNGNGFGGGVGAAAAGETPTDRKSVV